jgi:hypothetical protein
MLKIKSKLNLVLIDYMANHSKHFLIFSDYILLFLLNLNLNFFPIQSILNLYHQVRKRKESKNKKTRIQVK